MGKRKENEIREIKFLVDKIMVEENTDSPIKIWRSLKEKYNKKVSMPTLLKIISERKTEQPAATATTTGDSTDDEIENLTSIIEKLNKEFDKTDSNSERCRLGDSIGTAMKNREDLLMKKDERERAKLTRDNRPVIIRFGTMEEYNSPENLKKLRELFPPKDKTDENKTVSVELPAMIVSVEKPRKKCQFCDNESIPGDQDSLCLICRQEMNKLNGVD